MTRRIFINLAVVAAVFVGFTAWALSTIISIDAVRGPFEVTARFPASPGLARDFEVTYLGVRVGKVNEVQLSEGGADVILAIDRGSKIPKDVVAEVSRKSAVGEPFVDLGLPKGGSKGGDLGGGDRIKANPEAKVMDYQKLFSRLDRVLSAAPAKDVGTIVDETEKALDGRGETIRNIIDDSAQFTDTFADNSEVLDGTSQELTRLTRILAGEKYRLASSVNNFAEVTGALKASRKDVVNVLKTSPTLLGSVNRLLREARPDISCALRTAGTPNAPLLGRETNKNLSYVLDNVPTLVSLANDVTVKRPEGTYARNTFFVSLTDPLPAEEYRKKLKLPKPPPMTDCADIVPGYRSGDSDAEEGEDQPERNPADVAEATRSPLPEPSRPAEPQGSATPVDVKDSDTVSAQQDAEVAQLLPLLPPLGGVAVLVWVLGAIVGASTARRRAAVQAASHETSQRDPEQHDD